MLLLLAAALASIAPPSRAGFVPSNLSECVTKIINHDGAADIAVYDGIRNDNTREEYQNFLAKYPGSVCAPEARQYLADRANAAARIAAMPKNGPSPHQRRADWGAILTPDDFPWSTMRQYAGKDGAMWPVAAVWNIATDGYVEDCRITLSTGFDVLDKLTCRLISRRQRYYPARDAEGNPLRSTDSIKMRWTAPAESPRRQ